MRPTFSIICFTVLSGIGYGAWTLLGLAYAIGAWCAGKRVEAPLTPCELPFYSLPTLVLSFALVSIGLLCSLGHLGKPLRAWRALSQWRSSWLSREGVLALATFIPASWILAREILTAMQASRGPLEAMDAYAVFHGGFAVQVAGIVLAAGALATVYCTANIYASLKPIRAWHNAHVVPGYLLFALLGGCLLLLASGAAWSLNRWVLLYGVIVLSIAGAWLKISYWRAIDALPAPAAGHATGLSALGEVRSFEAPHTAENYLTHEMGFVLARKHARKLRRIALVLAFLVPGLLALLVLVAPAFGMPAAWLALASGLVGLLVERWLFFAEAKHAVMAYYAR